MGIGKQVFQDQGKNGCSFKQDDRKNNLTQVSKLDQNHTHT